jgi:hypothetical protein
MLPYQPLSDCLSAYTDDVPDDELVDRLGREATALTRIVPELADRLPAHAPPASAETGRRQLARAVAGWLRTASSSAPLVLLLDDLEHLDRETADLLRSTLLSTGTHPVLVIAAARDTGLGIDHPLHGLSAALRRQGMLRLLPLGPLSSDALGALADIAGMPSSAQTADTLAEETGGNPFFATQTLIALAAREPQAAASAKAGIADLIRERLSQLPEVTLDALTAAAVAGGRVPLHHLAGVLGIPADETAQRVAPAVAAHLLDEPSGGRYRFVHMLVREALLDRLGPTRRAQAHRRLAEHLEQVHGDHPELVLDQLAHHHAAGVVAGGDPTKAVEFGLEAGRQAFEQLADEVALSRYRAAWDALCRGAPTSKMLRRELLLRLGETENRLGRSTSYDTLLEAASLASAARDSPRLVRAALALARDRPHPGEPVDEPRVTVLRAALVANPTRSQRAVLLAALATEQTFAAPLADVQSLVDEALRHADVEADDSVLTRVLTSTAWVHLGTSDPDELMARSARHLQVARRLRDPAAAFDATSHRVLAALTKGDAAAVEDAVNELGRLARELGTADRTWQALTYQAIQALQRGDLEATRRAVDRAYEIATEHAIAEGRASRAALLFGLRFEEGRLAELVPELSSVAESAPALSIFRAAALVAASESGEEREVRDSLSGVVSAMLAEPADWFSLPRLAFYAHAACRSRHVEVARPLLDRLATYRPRFVFGGGAVWGHLHHHMGSLAALLDDPRAPWLLASAEDAHVRAGATTWAERSRRALKELKR